MAKKSNSTPQNRTLARIARTESYAEQVRAMFAATVNRIIALNKSLPVIEDGEMFSFDAQTEKMRANIELCLRQLHSVATTAIQQGIRLEWETANAECDKIVQTTFGKKVLENPEFGAWTKRNGAAMRAFIARSESGMNLSDRVWKSTRQLRDEMEIAITVAIGDGTSAARLSRNVRKYLNDPDLMFRRFRYKDPETGEWRRKWKKRVIDPATGKVTFIDYDKDSYQDQWTGRGYYKSAAMNAMRVARTETNIAYRRADNARWQQMDFVIGQRVHLSRSHPKKDICDKLAGDYPKDFVFDGWHPQCFCYVEPIMIDEDVYDELMNEDDWREAVRRYADNHQITDYPDNFKSWVKNNADNIAAARTRGTEPYFVRNNAGIIDNILNPGAKPVRTIEQATAERHAKRDEQDIRDRWNKRNERIATETKRIERIKTTANSVIDVALKRFAGLNIDTTPLLDAISANKADLIREETRKIAREMSEMQQRIRMAANNVKTVADGFREVDTTALTTALKTKNMSAIRAATKSLGQDVLNMKRAESALSDLIPDVHDLHNKFTLAEMQSAYSAIEKTLNRWTWDFSTNSSLSFLKGKLQNEIAIVVRDKKYSTWEIAKSAYEQRLALVEKRIEMKSISDSLTHEFDFVKTTRSIMAKQLANDFKTMFADNATDITALRNKADDFKAKIAQLEASAARRAAKYGKTISHSIPGMMSDDDIRAAFKNQFAKHGIVVYDSEITIRDGCVYISEKQHREISKMMNLTADEEKQIFSHSKGGYIQTANSFTINGALRDIHGGGKNAIRGSLSGNPNVALGKDMYGYGLKNDDIKTIETLDAVIARNKLGFPVMVVRNVDANAIYSLFGKKMGVKVSNVVREIQSLSSPGLVADPGFMSVSTDASKNVFTNRRFQLEIEIPASTPMFVSKNFQESECILGRSTNMQFVNARIVRRKNGGSFVDFAVIRVRVTR